MGRLEFGLGALQRGLADVVLLEELLLAFEVLARHVQRGAGGLHLGVAGGCVLVGRAGVDTHQHLAGGDAVAHLGVQLDDGARNLGGEHGRAQGFNDAIEGRCGGA